MARGFLTSPLSLGQPPDSFWELHRMLGCTQMAHRICRTCGPHFFAKSCLRIRWGGGGGVLTCKRSCLNLRENRVLHLALCVPRKLGECYEADLQRLGPTSGALLHRPRMAGSKDLRDLRGDLKVKAKAASLAQLNHFSQRSLDRLPAQIHIRQELERLNDENASPASPGVMDSSSGLGTGSLSLVPNRRDSGEIGAPSDLPPALEPALESQHSPQSPWRRPSDASEGCFAGFAAHACWLQKSKSTVVRRKSTLGAASANMQKSATIPTLASTSKPAYTIDPTGHFRNFWDCLGIFLLLKDSITIPLQFVVDDFILRFPVLFFITQVGVFYWAADILLSFATGYLHKGTLVQDLRKVWCHYLRTWFVPDILVTFVDFLLEFSSLGESVGETAATTRILRPLSCCAFCLIFCLFRCWGRLGFIRQAGREFPRPLLLVLPGS